MVCEGFLLGNLKAYLQQSKKFCRFVPLPSPRSHEPTGINGQSLALFLTVEANFRIEPDMPYHSLLSNTDKDDVKQHVGPLHLRYWEDDVLRLRATIAEKTWIGFDLDDILHEFRRSSGTATDKVLEEIAKRCGSPILALKGEYSRVLQV